jgi:hypothetical protein
LTLEACESALKTAETWNVDHRFRLQDSWLGCNGVVALALLVVAAAVALRNALRSPDRQAP